MAYVFLHELAIGSEDMPVEEAEMLAETILHSSAQEAAAYLRALCERVEDGELNVLEADDAYASQCLYV